MRYPLATLARVLGLSGFCILALIADLTGQTISGTVTERGTGTPAEAVHLLLVAPDEDSSVVGAFTDASGRFSMAVPPGLWQLLAERIGHRSSRSAPFQVQPGDHLFVEMEVPVEVVALDPLEVTVRRRHRTPGLTGFYDRLDRGVGRFITAEQIEERQARRFNDVLRAVPGLDIICGTESVFGTGCDIRLRRARSLNRVCPVQFFLDGTPASQEMVEILAPDHLAGVEVYNGLSDVPPRFRRGRDTRCGVIVVWVKARP